MTDLTFEIVDDLISALDAGLITPPSLSISALSKLRFGPAAELAITLSQRGLRTEIRDARLLRLLERFDELGHDTSNLGSLTPRSVEFVRPLRQTITEPDIPWIEYQKRAQKAAIAAGLERSVAQRLAVFLGELRDNVIEHSDNPRSCLVGYRHSKESYEIMVADSGIGVLSSLRKCPSYRHISDSREALRLAVTDGVSRYGPASRHGFGFQPLFLALLQYNAEIRLRSDRAALIMAGKGPLPSQSILMERSYIDGAFCHVLCWPSCRSTN